MRLPAPRALLLALFFLALAVRLGVAWKTADWVNPPAWEYGEIARSLLAGEGYAASMWFLPQQPTASKPPLYPLLLTAMLASFKSYGYAAMILLQCLAGAAACVLFVFMARKFFDEASALLGGLLFAFYPHAAYYARNIQPQTWSMLVLFAVVLFTARLWLVPRYRDAAVLGVLYGVALLLESSLGAFLPVSLYAAARGRDGWRRALLVLSVAVTLIVPWTVRNAVVLGEFVPLRSDFGLNLYAGNAPWSTGSLRTESGDSIWNEIPAAERQAAAEMSIGEVNREYRGRALHYMAAHPLQTLGRFCEKTAAFWWPFGWGSFRYRSGDSPEGRYPLLRQAVWAAPFFLGCIGLVLALARRRRCECAPLWLLVALLLLYPMSYGLTVVDGARYRVVVEPFHLLLAAWLGIRLMRGVAGRRARP